MVMVFEAYRQLSTVAIRPMMAISDLDTIREDIVASAQQKRAALILLPFHKVQQIDGALESIERAYQLINLLVLCHAPCSVGILIDRALGRSSQVSSSDVSYTVVVLFFDGPDNREALAYGALMAEHPSIVLIVLRFLSPPTGNLVDHAEDEVCIEKLRTNVLSIGAEDSVNFEETVAAYRAEILATIRNLRWCNLFLVGRSARIVSLVDSSSTLEFGPVGSYLASSEFSTTASVIVIQRYNPRFDKTGLVKDTAEVAYVSDSLRIQP